MAVLSHLLLWMQATWHLHSWVLFTIRETIWCLLSCRIPQNQVIKVIKTKLYSLPWASTGTHQEVESSFQKSSILFCHLKRSFRKLTYPISMLWRAQMNLRKEKKKIPRMMLLAHKAKTAKDSLNQFLLLDWLKPERHLNNSHRCCSKAAQ